VAANSRLYQHLLTRGDLGKEVQHEIEHFFPSYYEAKGDIQLLGRVGPAEANALLQQALR
jgi:inorganic pyrophosphatase